MPLGAKVDYKMPLRVSKVDGEPTIVKNITSPTVYYKSGAAGESVSSTLKDGELALGQELTLSQTTFFIAKAPAAKEQITDAQVEIFTSPAPTVFPEYSFQLSPAPSGGDDTINLQTWANQLGGNVQKGILQAGTFKTKEALKLKQGVEIEGVDRRYAVIEMTGNAFVFEPLAGDNVVSNLTVKAAAKQTGGGVVDFSKGFSENFWMRSCTIGNNFFNCFKCIPAGVTQISGLSFEDLLFEESGGPVEGYTEPVWLIGNPASNSLTEEGHVVWLKLVKCYCFSSNTGGKRVPLWMDIRNCDSIDVYDCGFQYGEQGIRIGHSDESVYKSQTIKVHQTFFDHITGIAVEVENTKDCRFNQTCVQGGGEGIVIGKETAAFSFQGGTVQSQNKNGIHLLASATILGVSILNSVISDNNQSAELEAAKIAGIKVEANTNYFQIHGCEIGGMVQFSGKQQFGIVVIKGKSQFFSITGNRIPEKAESPAENTIKAIVNETEVAEAGKWEAANNIKG
jgi:hypothetical protein